MKKDVVNNIFNSNFFRLNINTYLCKGFNYLNNDFK